MTKAECTLQRRHCYHAITGYRNCWNCSRNKNHNETELSDNYISTIDKVAELYEYLSGGEMPDGVKCWQPKMSKTHAFDVIWFLQEITHCLPDHIERCQGCDDLYDTDCEGYYLDDQYELNGKELPKKYWGCWCDSCVPAVHFILS